MLAGICLGATWRAVRLILSSREYGELSASENSAVPPSALGRGDLEAAAAACADVVWDTSARGADGTVVYGSEGVIDVIRDWLEVWEDVSFQMREIRDARDQSAGHVRQHARGRVSGVRGAVDAFATFKLGDGKIAAYREYSTWSAALEAVGLEA
jgi:ketosteroid isomerase-like protein